MIQTIYNKMKVFVEQAAGEMDIGGYMVPSINAPIILLDDLKPVLLEGDVPFAVMYWDEPEGRRFVMFSEDDGVINLGDIAAAYDGKGTQHMAAFKTPPLKDVAGEMIPLALEFPPDDMDVLIMYLSPMPVFSGKLTFIREAHHVKDGQFDAEDQDQIVAWAYMPEIPNSLDMMSM